jgi:adenosylcobyric acid synthase
MADEELYVELIQAYHPLESFDLILLPGSKTVISDLQWLKKKGLFEEILRVKKPIFGICGGYQMLCRSLHDPDAIEYETPCLEAGLDIIDDSVLYQNPKILHRGYFSLFSYPAIKGYEIHCGRMQKYPLFYQNEGIAGTHIHGIFDHDVFRNDYFKAINPQYQGYAFEEYREAQIQDFTAMVSENLEIDTIFQALQTR